MITRSRFGRELRFMVNILRNYPNNDYLNYFCELTINTIFSNSIILFYSILVAYSKFNISTEFYILSNIILTLLVITIIIYLFKKLWFIILVYVNLSGFEKRFNRLNDKNIKQD